MISNRHIQLTLPSLCLALASLILVPGSAGAQGNLVWIGEGKVCDLSADGSVAVGLTNTDLQVFRWTSAEGRVLLNGSTAALGIGGGEPQVSADGSRIAACIPAPDSLTVTQGLWTQGIGWETLIPPTPPGGGDSGGVRGTPWGISGDGETVVGLFFLTTQKAHASAWTAGGGVVDLGTSGDNSRANAASADGSVIVGWSDNPVTGTWQPAVWEDGSLTVLDPSGPVCQATAVTRSGHLIYGSSTEPSLDQAQATIWTRSDTAPTGWQTTRLGVLPGTQPFEGRSIIEDGSFDGRILIGLNYFSNFSIGYFVWTPAQGLEPVGDYFARIGVTFPSSFRINRISAISEDGTVIAGYGYDLYNPVVVSFLVTTNDVAGVPAAAAVARMAIESNYPNPFNPMTTIALRVDEPGSVRLAIHDVQGRLVKVLQEGFLAAGRHEYRWDGRAASGNPAAGGVYLARARDAAGGTSTRRLTLVK